MVAVQAPVFQSSLFLRTVWSWASCLTPLSLCEMGVLLPLPDGVMVRVNELIHGKHLAHSLAGPCAQLSSFTSAGLQQHLSLLWRVPGGPREQLCIQHPPGLPPEPSGLPAPLLLWDSAAVRAGPSLCLLPGVFPAHSALGVVPPSFQEGPRPCSVRLMGASRVQSLCHQLQTSGTGHCPCIPTQALAQACSWGCQGLPTPDRAEPRLWLAGGRCLSPISPGLLPFQDGEGAASEAVPGPGLQVTSQCQGLLLLGLLYSGAGSSHHQKA